MSSAADLARPAVVPIQLLSPAGPVDMQLHLCDRTVTLAEVFGAVGLESDQVSINEAPPVAAASVVAHDVLRGGSVLTEGCLTTTASRTPVQRHLEAASLVQVAQVAGIDCGRISELQRGHFQIDEPDVCDAQTRWYVAVDHDSHFAVDRRPWHERASTIETVEVPDGVLALNQPIDCEPGPPGVLRRPPRHLPADDVLPIPLTAPPPQPTPAQPLSWATFLTPIPIGVIMAVFFSPIFALFSALGPAVALGRWIEARRRFTRESTARTELVSQTVARVQALIADQVESVARSRWAASPHVPELWRRARSHSVRLWERRPGQLGYLHLMVGVGADAIEPVFSGAAPDPEAHGVVGESLLSRPVPHMVDLAVESGIGVWGERTHAVAQVRSLLLQLVTLHGPADVTVGVLCPQARAQTWDFVKWLPHCSSGLVSDQASVLCAAFAATTGPGLAGKDVPAGLSRPIGSSAGAGLDCPVTVVVVDDPAADVAALERTAQSLAIEIRVIALAATPTGLPAACSALVEVGDGAARLSYLSSLSGTTGCAWVFPAGVSGETATSWARSLAAVADPEAPVLASAELSVVNLHSVIGRVDSAELLQRWGRDAAQQRPVAAIGLGDDGTVAIDFGSDGPHALVAGTTGSGKSELLRTLVMSLAVACSPEHLNFVLVDFKGGGAFDVCSNLPHVAGLITDLDEHLVARAIRSLQAELHRREVMFRDLGVSTFDHAVVATSEPIARLVVVIDEFAALATDYGELLHAIIDLAARGRSLGMHLVLATQRPSGVVDQKIRANTNLRIALRVQDAVDSHDVVGTPDAAIIDRRRPGRAVVSIGGDRPFSVQTAYGGAMDRRGDRCHVQPFSLGSSEGCGVVNPSTRSMADVDGASVSPQTEFESVLFEIECAAASMAHVPRALWAEPLPQKLSWHELGAIVESAAGMPSTAACSADDAPEVAYSLGVVDIPEDQQQLPWRWMPDAGALVVFGGSAPCAGHLLTSLGCSAATAESAERCHLYVIDGDAGRVRLLDGLPHVGAYVTLDEPDRIERVIALAERALSHRRQPSASEPPRVLLVIDNVAAVLAVFDDVARAAMTDRLAALARDGAALGVQLAMTARTVRDVPHRLAQQIPQRMVMSLADSAGYLALGIKSRDVVDLPDMRAIELATGRLVQLVEPPASLDVIDTAQPTSDRAPSQVAGFPSAVSIEQLPPARTGDVGGLVVPIAIGERDLEPVALVLAPGEHALVVGPPGKESSSVLRAIEHQLERGGLDVSVYLIGAAGSGLTESAASDRVLVTEQDIDALADLAGCVVLVDNADRLAAGIPEALTRLLANRSASHHVVVAVTPEFARLSQAWVVPLRSSATGVYVGCNLFDGDILKTRLPKVSGLGSVAGRGHLVVRGRAEAVQLAMSTPCQRHATSPAGESIWHATE